VKVKPHNILLFVNHQCSTARYASLLQTGSSLV